MTPRKKNQKLGQLSPRRRRLLATGLGALASLALPPSYLIPVLLVSFTGLIRLMEAAETKKEAFLTGWLYGFGYFVVGLYWITFSLFIDFESWWWSIPFVIAGLPGYLALYPAAACLTWWMLQQLLKPGPAAGLLWFAVLWSVAAWLRGHLLTGFPWNMEAYIWSGVLPMMQSTAWIGAYGLTLLTVFWAGLPVLAGKKEARTTLFGGLALFAIIFLLGTARVLTAPTEFVPGVGLRIVQPSIPQKIKWLASERIDHLRQHNEMTALPSTIEQPITHVLWPETAITFMLDQNPGLSEQIASWLPKDALLLAGTYRDVPELEGRAFNNSLAAINAQGRVLDYFDKFHLVPWGEYIPYKEFIPLQAIAGNIGEFVPGNGPYLVDGLPNTPPFSPLICYEVIFPGAVKKTDTRPQWLISVTNDGWFGKNTGPHQHLAQARMRAVEEGVPLARAASSGISAFVDPYGRILNKLGLGAVGIIDSPLPKPVPHETFFSRHGNLVFWILLAVTAALATLGSAWHQKRK